jgi:hypothetical protein
MPERPQPFVRGATVRALCALALLSACALPPLQPGMTEVDVLRSWGVPTGRHALPDGGTRMEYASGPYGKVTWMVDLDAQGQFLRAEQVLDEAHFSRVNLGMSSADVLRLLGRPADRLVDFRDRQTWYWRYESVLCLWFGVTFSPQGIVIEGGHYSIDPICEPRDFPR